MPRGTLRRITNWYRAYCPKHNEACVVFVRTTGGGVGPAYPAGAAAATVRFLGEHYGCRLELVRDDQPGIPEGATDLTPP